MYKHNNEIMCSLDVTVTNYKCDTETIHIYLDKLYSLPDLPKIYLILFYRMRSDSAAKKPSHFIFDGHYYDQIEGVAMSSPLRPVLAAKSANIFVCQFEEM